jgi:murein DD-endopeptidase MepM/ murein hydrolase activator NlpD
VVAIFSIFIYPVQAQSMQDLQNYQELVKSQREIIQKQQEQINALVKPAQERLEALRKNVRATDAEIQKNQQILTKTASSLNQLQIKFKELKQALDLKRQATSDRLRYLQRQQTAQWWALLLSSRDLGQFSDRRRQLNQIYLSDRTLLTSLNTSTDTVAAQAQKITTTQNEIILINQKLANQKASFEEEAKAQTKVVTRLKSDRKALEAAEDRLAQDSIQIRNLIISKVLPPGSIITSTGQMMYPLIAPITSPFGWRTHPILGYQKFHSGMDFGADYGSVIYAADSGKVIYAGWYGGYGNAVIIDHGGDLTTLYAHASQLYVSEGETIQKGQPVAAVGSTGFSTGPHLHFEVRSNGEPVDPAQFL